MVYLQRSLWAVKSRFVKHYTVITLPKISVSQIKKVDL